MNNYSENILNELKSYEVSVESFGNFIYIVKNLHSKLSEIKDDTKRLSKFIVHCVSFKKAAEGELKTNTEKYISNEQIKETIKYLTYCIITANSLAHYILNNIEMKTIEEQYKESYKKG